MPASRVYQWSGAGPKVSPPVGAAATCGPHVRPFTAQLGSFGIASFSIVQFTCVRSTADHEQAPGVLSRQSRLSSMSTEQPARRTMRCRTLQPSGWTLHDRLRHAETSCMRARHGRAEIARCRSMSHGGGLCDTANASSVLNAPGRAMWRPARCRRRRWCRRRRTSHQS